MPKLCSVFLVYIFLGTQLTYAQIGATLEDLPVSPKKNFDKSYSNVYLFDHGFFIDALLHYVHEHTLYQSQSYNIARGASVGISIGNKWYFGRSKFYRPGIALIWAKTHLALVNDDFGMPLARLIFSPLNLGFVQVLRFNDETGLELNLFAGFNGLAMLDSTLFMLGYVIQPELKFRYKKLSIGFNFCYFSSDSPSNSNLQQESLLLGLSIGGKF